MALSRDAFRREVLDRAQKEGLSPARTAEALDLYEARHGATGFFNDDVRHALDLARWGAGIEGETQAVLFSPGVALAAGLLRRRIQPWVDDVREEMRALDGAVGLPFSDLAEAAKWVESAAAKGGEVVSLLPFQDPREGEWVRRVSVRVGSPLEPLAGGLPDLSKATGFHPARITSLVIADVPPMLPLLTMEAHVSSHTLPRGGSLSRREVFLRVFDPDLSLEQLREVHQFIRDTWDAAGLKPISEEEVSLWLAVERLGGVPTSHGEKGPFWRAVAAEIGLSGGDWRTAYRRFNRLKDKLERTGRASLAEAL